MLSRIILSNKILFFVVFVLSFSFLNCSKSYATRELQESNLDVAKRSEAIVVARCISSESRWNDEGTLIFTYVTFEIQHTIKGKDPKDKLTLKLIGGQVGDVIQTVPDLPVFNEEGEVMLFLGPINKDGYPTLASMKNGALQIQTDIKTGQKIVTTPTSGLEIYRENTEREISSQEAEGVLLEDMIYSLRKALNQ